MAEKIEMEKPVVSKKLAEMYENKELKDDFLTLTTPILYINTPDYVDENQMGLLLSKMYVLGYEIEKPKKLILQLPHLNDGTTGNYLCDYFSGEGWRRTWDKKSADKFTKAEIKADEGLKKLASVCELVEVEE